MSRATETGSSLRASREKPPDSSNQEERHPDTYGHIRHIENPGPKPTQSQDDKIDNRAAEQHPVHKIADAAAADERETQKRDAPDGGDSRKIDQEQPQKTSNGNGDEDPPPFFRQSRFEAEHRPLVLRIMKRHPIRPQRDGSLSGQDRFHYGLAQLIAPNSQQDQQEDQNKPPCSHQWIPR